MSGAAGPVSFDCWGLVCHVLKHRRGLELTPYGGVKETGLLMMMRAADHEVKSHWEQIVFPVHFCVVAMSRGSRAEHVGIWVDEGGGGILHSCEGSGVVFQTTTTIRNTGSQNFTFYKLRQ